MEKKELSAGELIELARACMERGDCFNCALCDTSRCEQVLIMLLAQRLEEAHSPSVAFGDSSLPEGALKDEDRLTARENGHAYFVRCFEEPCLSIGCKNENCEFMWLVCERLCRFEEGARVYGIEWIDCKAAKPAEADEYLVIIKGAKKPTVLHYDPVEEAFYEEEGDETVWYPVTHWAELPEGPVGASSARPKEDGDTERGRSMTAPTVKRCATCRYEDKLAECDRCIACEKHNLWEAR